MPKDELLRRINQRPTSGSIYGGGGGGAVGGGGANADTLDGLHASAFLSPDYLVLALDANLTRERALALGNGLSAVDAGAGGSYTLSVALAADPGLEFASGLLRMGTPGTLTVATTNAKSGAGHTHAVTASADVSAGGTALLKSASGVVRLLGLGLGADVDLSRKAANVLQLASGDSFESSTYNSGYAGWAIRADGSAEFANVVVRGSLHAGVFVKDLISAHAGTMLIAKSAGVLSVDMEVPASGTWTMTLDDPPGGGFLFDNSDIARCKSEYSGGVAEVWCTVASRTDNGDGTQSYTCTYQSGTRGVTYPAGATVVDYGASGQGLLTMTAESALHGPYYSVAAHAGAPWTAISEVARLGNLNGVAGVSADRYGLFVGDYAGRNYLLYDPTDGFVLKALSGKLRIEPDTGISVVTDTDFEDLRGYRLWRPSGYGDSEVGALCARFIPSYQGLTPTYSDVRLRATGGVGVGRVYIYADGGDDLSFVELATVSGQSKFHSLSITQDKVTVYGQSATYAEFGVEGGGNDSYWPLLRLRDKRGGIADCDWLLENGRVDQALGFYLGGAGTKALLNTRGLFLNGAGAAPTSNTAMCLAGSIENVGADQKAVVTVTYAGSGHSNRNWWTGRFWVRVGYYDEATYAQHCAVYEVVACSRHSANVADKRNMVVTRHCYGAASGGWTPPATTDFAYGTCNQSQFQFTVDNVGSGAVDVDVVMFEGHNSASLSVAAV